MRHSQLWCLTWDVKESPMAVFWRCLDQHPSITFDWLKSSAVAILAMEKFRYCCSSEFLCEWDWLILILRNCIDQRNSWGLQDKKCSSSIVQFSIAVRWSQQRNLLLTVTKQSSCHGMILAILSGHFGAKPETRPRKGILVQFNSGMTKSFTPFSTIPSVTSQPEDCFNEAILRLRRHGKMTARNSLLRSN